jgi:predicted alpha/beta-fold hydrolase
MIINHVKHKHQHSKLFCVSYSMGANLLLRFLGKEKNSQLTAAISISNPFDFAKSADIFRTNFIARTLYSETLAAGAKKIVMKNTELVPLFIEHLVFGNPLSISKNSIK